MVTNVDTTKAGDRCTRPGARRCRWTIWSTAPDSRPVRAGARPSPSPARRAPASRPSRRAAPGARRRRRPGRHGRVPPRRRRARTSRPTRPQGRPGHLRRRRLRGPAAAAAAPDGPRSCTRRGSTAGSRRRSPARSRSMRTRPWSSPRATTSCWTARVAGGTPVPRRGLVPRRAAATSAARGLVARRRSFGDSQATHESGSTTSTRPTASSSRPRVTGPTSSPGSRPARPRPTPEGALTMSSTTSTPFSKLAASPAASAPSVPSTEPTSTCTPERSSP